MNKKELKKLIIKEGYEVYFSAGYVLIQDRYLDKAYLGLELKTDRVYIIGTTSVNTVNLRNCLIALLQYANTPESQRGGDLLYTLQLPSSFSPDNRYLVYSHKFNIFFTHHEPHNDSNIKGMFTQKEIDELPEEFKKSIDCGFIKQVVVL